MAGNYGCTQDICVAVRLAILISFPDDNLSKNQWIFTKLGMHIDIVEVCFGVANGQISQIVMELPAQDKPIFSFPDDNLSKCKSI